MKALRDKNGRFTKGCTPPGEPFRTLDERARAAGKASGAARREMGDLKRLLRVWMNSEVDTDEEGNPITGAQLMIKVAVRQMKKGNPRFWELLRDTAGFKPVDRVMVSEVDPEVVDEVENYVLETIEGMEENENE